MAGDSGNNEVDDCVGEQRNDQTDDSIKDGVFSVGDFFVVAAGNDITETTVNQHNNRNNTNDKKQGVGDFSEDTSGTNQFGWHNVGFGGFSAFLNGEGEDFQIIYHYGYYTTRMGDL